MQTDIFTQESKWFLGASRDWKSHWKSANISTNAIDVEFSDCFFFNVGKVSSTNGKTTQKVLTQSLPDSLKIAHKGVVSKGKWD